MEISNSENTKKYLNLDKLEVYILYRESYVQKS